MKEKLESLPCECGCGSLAKPGNRFILGHSGGRIKVKKELEIRICICGCNQAFECKIDSEQEYITGHNRKGEKLSEEQKEKRKEKMKEKREKYPNGIPIITRICECGCAGTFQCEETSDQRFIGKHAQKKANTGRKHIKEIRKKTNKCKFCGEDCKNIYCSKSCYFSFVRQNGSFNKLPRKIIHCLNCGKEKEVSINDKIKFCSTKCMHAGRIIPVETRICACGCGETFVCKVISDQRYINHHASRAKEIKEKIGSKIKGRPSPLKGRKQTLEHRINSGLPKRGRKYSLEHCENIGKALTGLKRTKEQCENISLSKMGKSQTEESNRKRRLAILKRIKENHGKVFPAYNKQACDILKLFDEKNHTHGQYAVYGGGEYEVPELGYFLDYIEHEYKIIMEIYEKHHFNKDGSLRQKDVIREREIKTLYPDHKFHTFKEEEMNKILEISLRKLNYVKRKALQ